MTDETVTDDPRTDDPTTLSELRALTMARLQAGVVDQTAAARHPALATRDSDGWPAVRTLVLRRFDPQDWVLDLHSDADASKVLQLTDDPRAMLHVWDPQVQLQIRLRAHVTRLHGEEVAALWDKVPESSREAYGAVPPPGTSIPAADAWRSNPRPARFAVLRCRVTRIEALHLGNRHRRARFERETGWQGGWLVP